MIAWRKLTGLAGLMIIVGCAPEPEALEATEIPITATATVAETDTAAIEQSNTVPPSDTIVPEPTSTLSDTPVPSPTAPPERPLAAEGPWLVVSGWEGNDSLRNLWALNPDGTGLTQLNTDPVVGFAAPSSENGSHGQVAFVTSSPQSEMIDLKLHVIQLPNIQPILSIPLTSEQNAYVEGSEWEDGARTQEIARSLSKGLLRWSPDGTTLAFAGAMQGDSSDVYTYSLTTQAIRQITSGEFEIASLSWSPNGAYIVHVAVLNFGTGAGESVDSVWAASADGSGSARLYGADDQFPIYSGGESLRWLDNQHLLASSWIGDCGIQRLRIITLSGTSTPLWDDCYTSSAFDPTTQNIMLTVADEYGNHELGIYFIDGQSHEVRQVSTEAGEQVEWDEAEGRFIVLVGATRWGFTSTGEPQGEIQWPDFMRYARFISWSSDHNLVAALSPGITIAQAPDFAPIQVSALDCGCFWAQWVR